MQVAARRLALSEMNSDAVSYTYAAKGEHNVEVIKKPKGLNHKIIIRRNM